MASKTSKPAAVPEGNITLQTIADAAGVSLATASRALSGTGRMKSETRDRVMRVAKLHNFRPSGVARSLSTKRTYTIGFLNNDLTGRLTLPVMAGVTAALFDRGVSVFLCSIEDNPILAQRHVEAMIDKRVDGIVAAGKRTDRQVPIELANLGIPVVYTIVQPEPNSICFTVDDEGGGRLATQYLIDRGRKRIAHVTGPSNFRVVHERAIGYKAAMRDAGLTEPEIGIIMDDWAERAGHDAVRLLFEGVMAPPPDAIFCGNDQIARGAIDALTLRGIAVPHSVSVIGYDNWHYYAEEARPPLTTVDMNLEELGRIAGETLLRIIDGETVEPGTRRLPCTVIERKSA